MTQPSPADRQCETIAPVPALPNGMTFGIRWMLRRDMPDVLAIENDVYEYPWSEESFIRCLRQRNCIGMVASFDTYHRTGYIKDYGPVVAYMIYELHHTRLHLLNFAVHSEWWRRGIGSAMMDKLIRKLSQQRRRRIFLECRESNVRAQLFFRALGFRAVSVVRDFYDDLDEAAYLFQYRLMEPAHV